MSVPETGQEAVVEVVCSFPAPMRTAVVFARMEASSGGELSVEASLGGERFVPWPVDDGGGLARRVALSSASGARELVVRARLRSAAAPTPGRADVQFLRGVVFGGHWQDEPPCFAVVADPGGRATLGGGQVSDYEVLAAPRWREVGAAELDQEVFGPYPGGLLPVEVEERTAALWLGGSTEVGAAALYLARLSYPELVLERREVVRGVFDGEVAELNGQLGKGLQLVMTADLGGDGVRELAVGAPRAPRSGWLFAGAVTVVHGESLAPLWKEPTGPPASVYGDDEFGRDLKVFQLPAPKSQRDAAESSGEALLVSVVGHMNEAGERVGRMVALDARSGEELWGAPA